MEAKEVCTVRSDWFINIQDREHPSVDYQRSYFALLRIWNATGHTYTDVCVPAGNTSEATRTFLIQADMNPPTVMWLQTSGLGEAFLVLIPSNIYPARRILLATALQAVAVSLLQPLKWRSVAYQILSGKQAVGSGRAATISITPFGRLQRP